MINGLLFYHSIGNLTSAAMQPMVKDFVYFSLLLISCYCCRLMSASKNSRAVVPCTRVEHVLNCTLVSTVTPSYVVASKQIVDLIQTYSVPLYEVKINALQLNCTIIMHHYNFLLIFTKSLEHQKSKGAHRAN